MRMRCFCCSISVWLAVVCEPAWAQMPYAAPPGPWTYGAGGYPPPPPPGYGYGYGPAYANPAYANPAYANPAYANPAYANPAYANPAYANPAWNGGPYRMAPPAPAYPVRPAVASGGAPPYVTGYMMSAPPLAAAVAPQVPAAAPSSPPAPPPAPLPAAAADAKSPAAPPAVVHIEPAPEITAPTCLPPAEPKCCPPPLAYPPQMIGDLIGYSAAHNVTVNGRGLTPLLPVLTFGSFKIAENESPRPQTRIFGTYDFFNNVNGDLNPTLPSFDVHRETFGFELAFLNNFASVGMRMPSSEVTGDKGLAHSEFNDISIVTKVALLSDPISLSVISSGMVITVPTGSTFDTAFGHHVNPVLLQPYLGYILNLDRIYIHGFTSCVVPTELRDPVLMTSDLGLGFWMYRTNCKRFLTGIVPTVEGHANAPVSNRGIANTPVGFEDQGVVTGGIHFIFCRNTTLTLGASVPLTGPQPYDIEATAQFNFRF